VGNQSINSINLYLNQAKLAAMVCQSFSHSSIQQYTPSAHHKSLVIRTYFNYHGNIQRKNWWNMSRIAWMQLS